MRYKIDTIEPFWWGLFMAGAGVIGILLPIEMIIFGWAIPLGTIPAAAYSPSRMAALLGNPIVKLYLFVLISLPLFHWAHRFRYFVFDLGLRGARMPMAVLCYGAAVVGTIAAAITLIRL